jgi:drug/metabolite transporter (DMT)-like permease
MEHFSTYLLVSGVVLSIFGIVLLASPENFKAVAGFMLAAGLLLSLGVIGYYVYNNYYNKEAELVSPVA